MTIRSSFLPAVVVFLTISLLVLSPPLAAQEKPADASSEKAKTMGGKKLSPVSNTVEGSGNGPAIHFPEPLHDFGTIASGSKVTHNFRVLNRGSEPLKLIKAKGS